MFCVIIDVIAFDHIGGIPLQLQHSQGANLGQDKISRLLFQLALPAILAQLINLLYNMVDRMYIGHIPDVGPNALTGVGVTPAADHVHFRLCRPGEHGGRAPCLHP